MPEIDYRTETPAEMQARCDELEDKAFRGEELPKGLSFPDQLLFLRFRYLYAYARVANLSPEQGKREKQEILQTYLSDYFNAFVYQDVVKLWKEAEAASSAIYKDEDLMQNDKVRALLKAIYNVLPDKKQSTDKVD